MQSLVCSLSVCVLAMTALAGDDPKHAQAEKPEFRDLTIKDQKRAREIPIRVYLPKEKSPAPVVIFSHGLGGSREGYAYLGNHWASNGYVVVALQHPGSDDSVWKDKPVNQRMAAMQKAANVENFLLRVQDVPAALDQLEAWNKTEGHILAGRMDLMHVGMSGHSFGAITTQAVCGQAMPTGKGFADTRLKAAVAMSPSPPARGDAKKAFGEVKLPWLLMTGTKDNSPIGNSDAKSRLQVFPALQSGNKYELVFDKAEHSAFSDHALPGDTEKRNPNHQKASLAITTAFWDAYLRDDAKARAWLEGDEVRKVLEKDDLWQKK